MVESSVPSAGGSVPPVPGSNAGASLRMRDPPLDAAAKERLVEQITASMAEMIARALRQGVEQGVEKALGGEPVRTPIESATQAAEQAQREKPQVQSMPGFSEQGRGVAAPSKGI